MEAGGSGPRRSHGSHAVTGSIVGLAPAFAASLANAHSLDNPLSIPSQDHTRPASCSWSGRRAPGAHESGVCHLSCADDPTLFAHPVSDLHLLLHDLLRFMIPHAIPFARADCLQIIDRELATDCTKRRWPSETVPKPCIGATSLTLTSTPFSSRDSGSAFMSQHEDGMMAKNGGCRPET